MDLVDPEALPSDSPVLGLKNYDPIDLSSGVKGVKGGLVASWQFVDY